MNIRYLVNDLDRAVDFYSSAFGFQVVRKVAPSFALMKLGDTQIWLSGPGSPTSAQLTDGSQPQPGGWNRIILSTSDLGATITYLKTRAAKFRGERFETPAGMHILIEDPSGDLLEIVEFRRQAQVTH